MSNRFSPLSSSFMIFAMIGFIITAVYTNSGGLDPSWGLTFLIIFTVLFFASILSMTKAPVEAELEIDYNKRKREQLHRELYGEVEAAEKLIEAAHQYKPEISEGYLDISKPAKRRKKRKSAKKKPAKKKKAKKKSSKRKPAKKAKKAAKKKPTKKKKATKRKAKKKPAKKAKKKPAKRKPAKKKAKKKSAKKTGKKKAKKASKRRKKRR
ncbi:hypothetical protein ACFL0W_01260 [Nanoarchaeota archaeon]